MVIHDRCQCENISDPMLASEHSPLCPVFNSYAELEHGLANQTIKDSFFKRILKDLF